jgi:hypothetical protein
MFKLHIRTAEEVVGDRLAAWRTAASARKLALKRAMRTMRKDGQTVYQLVGARLLEVDPALADDWDAADPVARLSVETQQIIEAVLSTEETDELFRLAETVASAPAPPAGAHAPGDPVVVGRWYREGDVVEIGGVIAEVTSGFLFASADWQLEHLLAHLQARPVGNQWTPGIAVKVDELWVYDGLTYRVVIAHTTQSDWLPPNEPALWELVA